MKSVESVPAPTSHGKRTLSPSLAARGHKTAKAAKASTETDIPDESQPQLPQLDKSEKSTACPEDSSHAGIALDDDTFLVLFQDSNVETLAAQIEVPYIT